MKKGFRQIASEIDENEVFPCRTVKKMGRLGFFGIPFLREVGGVGGHYSTYIMAVEEVAKACASTTIILSAHILLCCWPIFAFGTDEQKKKYLSRLLTGESLGAFALTEPNAGNDAGNQQTTAKFVGDAYKLNGTTVFYN